MAIETYLVYSNDVAHIYLARTLSAGPFHKQGDEELEVRWLALTEAVQGVMTGDITESVNVAAILKVELLRRERILVDT